MSSPQRTTRMPRMTRAVPILCFLLGGLFGINYWIPWKLEMKKRMTLSRYFFQSGPSFCPNVTEVTLPECPEMPPRLLGPLDINLMINLSVEEVLLAYPNVQFGGHFKPVDCVARQRIAVIIPFRKREPHLKLWLFYMHQFLQRQQGDYGIYVAEQFGEGPFNRAKLMNVGFTEALKDYDYNCFIFSDIDIIPMDDRNYYRCSRDPRHMANAVDKFNFRLLYSTLFGGVTAFSKEQFLKVNGFSNEFWGWGGEDDEMYKRVVNTGMKVERPSSTIARSKMIPHKRDPGNEPNRKNVYLINLAPKTMHEDGVSSVKYDIISITKQQLYTMVSVDIGMPEEQLTIKALSKVTQH